MLITVKDIVIKYLKDNGCDGLCNEGCGCGLDDLFPCDPGWQYTFQCMPAKKIKETDPKAEDYGEDIYIPADLDCPVDEFRKGYQRGMAEGYNEGYKDGQIGYVIKLK